MDITPVNGHLLIEPLEHKTYLPSDHGTYEEIGTVVARPWWKFWWPRKGEMVWFDSWMSAKYPNGESFIWLVKFKDIRAIKHV